MLVAFISVFVFECSCLCSQKPLTAFLILSFVIVNVHTLASTNLYIHGNECHTLKSGPCEWERIMFT